MSKGLPRDPMDIPGLKRFEFPPTEGQPTVGAAVMIHGQGDHAGR